MGMTRQHFVNGNHRKRLIRQIQQNVSRNALRSAAVRAAEATDTTNTTIWKPKILNCRMSCVCAAGGLFHTTETTDTTETTIWKPGFEPYRYKNVSQSHEERKMYLRL